jgi:hypothetical protein
MLFFLICADEEIGRRECHARGWVQAGVTRFYTPERDDVRVIRRYVDVVLMPGGTWLMAGSDFWDNPDAERFCELVSGGHANWLTNHRPGRRPPPQPIPSPAIRHTGETSSPPSTTLTEVPPPRRYRATKAEMEERRRAAARRDVSPPPEEDDRIPPWETFREEMS